MASLLAHPFELGANGSFVVRDEATDEYIAERLALILSTRPGERPAVPLFGMDDPAFHELSLPELQVQCELFLIPVEIIDVTTRIVSDGDIEFSVEFNRIEEDDDEDE